jgi:biopolymer transport protein ExbD
VPLDLPKATQGKELQTILSVVVPIDGALLVDGAPLADGALPTAARAALARDPELRAVIQADRNVKHGRVIEVLDGLRAGGLTRVAFAAVRPEPPAPSPAAAAP